MNGNRVLREGISLVVGVALLGIAIPAPAWAAQRPSFNLEHSSWKATHIVLTTEGDAIDGHLRVLASWKGDLEEGAEIILPDLASLADEESREIRAWSKLPDLPEPYVRGVTGAEMVLFLIKSVPSEKEGSSTDRNPDWQPTTIGSGGSLRYSIVWIERGEAYAFVQIMNPGPSALTHIGTAVDMKARVAASNVLAAALDEAVVNRDPVLAAQVVRASSRQEFHDGVRDAIDALGRMGENALPMLRVLLDDVTLRHLHPDVISSMAKAGPADVAPDLTAVIDEELEYWKSHAPNLRRGWWNNAPVNERRGLLEHFSKLSAALRELRPLRYPPCRDVVLAVQEIWQSHDALREIGDGQIVRACDDLIDSLDSAPPSQ